MKVELHLHTSRHSPCARHRPEELLTRLVATGYDAVYLTEHDALWGEGELAAADFLRFLAAFFLAVFRAFGFWATSARRNSSSAAAPGRACGNSAAAARSARRS